MENRTISQVPINANYKIEKGEYDKNVDQKTYGSVIGSYLYLTAIS